MDEIKQMTEKTEQIDSISNELLRIASQLMSEMHPNWIDSSSLRLDSRLDRDIGLDSLGRVELFSRIERSFDLSLPEQLLGSAETLRDLLRAISSMQDKLRPGFAPVIQLQAPEEAEMVSETASTLLDVLELHYQAHPERTHIILYDDTGDGDKISYADLRGGAEKIACGLLKRGLEPRQTVAIMLPTSPEYFYSFFGILLAGGIPVPIYPPTRLSQIEDHLRRHAGILANAQVKMMITVPEARSVAWLLKSQTTDLRSVLVPQELIQDWDDLLYPQINTHDTAFLQYTSGSTGNPKGVILSHVNLLANIRAMGLATRIKSTDVFVSWLPLYHDMGLIGAWLGSLYYAAPLVIMSPLDFLTRPERWLRAIHRYRGTLSAAPNFAYELCLKKVKDIDMQGVDLGSWRMAFNGAEPVSVASMIAFRERFAAYGFRPEAIAPVYGLAESSVGLAFPPVGRGLQVDRIRRGEFMSTGHAVPAEDSDNEALVFAAAGFPLPGHQIRIIDNMGHELPERMEGRLEFCGPSATSGYFRNQQETRRLFNGEWLDSGDLAYQAAGEIYITGRSKDIIIKAGRNMYPYELEEAVGAVPGIRKGCVAVFGSSDPVSGTERLIVLAETREIAPEKLEQLRDLINGLALDLLGSPPDDIVLAPPHTVLKTSSGKIRRAASRQFYEQGGRAVRTAPVWLQFLRLAWSGTVTQSRNLMSALQEILYAGYIWCLFAIIAPIAWLLACLMPFPAWSWTVSRTIARSFLFLAGIRLDIEGTENLPEDIPCILVANHSSYLDGLVLVAALRGCYGFVAKRELENSIISRLYLQRMGSEFVERFDYQQGLEDTGRIRESVMKGRSLIFFPEGTFSRRAGLMQFKIGAFLVGAQTSTTVVPVTIRGTRSILHPGHWFPRQGAVSITIIPGLKEDGTDWDAAIRLKDAARAEILQHCGEPDMSDR